MLRTTVLVLPAALLALSAGSAVADRSKQTEMTMSATGSQSM